MRKADNGEKKEKKEKRKQKKKIMTFIVATNVIASRPPEGRATGTPHARANKVPYMPVYSGKKVYSCFYTFGEQQLTCLNIPADIVMVRCNLLMK